MSSPSRQRLETLDALLTAGWDPPGLLRVLGATGEGSVHQRLAAYLGCTCDIARDICSAPLEILTPEGLNALREEALALRERLGD